MNGVGTEERKSREGYPLLSLGGKGLAFLPSSYLTSRVPVWRCRRRILPVCERASSCRSPRSVIGFFIRFLLS